MTNNKKLEQTLQLIDLGFSVILLKADQKAPMHSGWQEKASNDKEEITKLLEVYPNANIGIVTGLKSGIIALDFDIKKGQKGLETYNHLKGLFGDKLDTLKSHTPSGGFHLFFKYNPNDKIGNKIGVLGGLNIKSDNGLVAIAPSQIDGNSYKWDDIKKPILKLPEELVPIIKYGIEVLLPCGTPESKRDDTLFQYARGIHKHIKSKTIKEKYREI